MDVSDWVLDAYYTCFQSEAEFFGPMLQNPERHIAAAWKSIKGDEADCGLDQGGVKIVIRHIHRAERRIVH